MERSLQVRVMKLSDLLSVARQMRGVTLRDVEVKTGISNATISQLENGKIKNPGWFTVIKIANVLDIDMKLLLQCDQNEDV